MKDKAKEILAIVDKQQIMTSTYREVALEFARIMCEEQKMLCWNNSLINIKSPYLTGNESEVSSEHSFHTINDPHTVIVKCDKDSILNCKNVCEL